MNDTLVQYGVQAVIRYEEGFCHGTMVLQKQYTQSSRIVDIPSDTDDRTLPNISVQASRNTFPELDGVDVQDRF